MSFGRQKPRAKKKANRKILRISDSSPIFITQTHTIYTIRYPNQLINETYFSIIYEIERTAAYTFRFINILESLKTPINLNTATEKKPVCIFMKSKEVSKTTTGANAKGKGERRRERRRLKKNERLKAKEKKRKSMAGIKLSIDMANNKWYELSKGVM